MMYPSNDDNNDDDSALLIIIKEKKNDEDDQKTTPPPLHIPKSENKIATTTLCKTILVSNDVICFGRRHCRFFQFIILIASTIAVNYGFATTLSSLSSSSEGINAMSVTRKSTPKKKQRLRGEGTEDVVVHVFQNRPDPPSKQRMNRMKAMIQDTDESSHVEIRHHIPNENERRRFLQNFGTECYPSSSSSKNSTAANVVLEKYDELGNDDAIHRYNVYRIELWKYCALFLRGGAFIDGETPLLQMFEDSFWKPSSSASASKPFATNYAVFGPSRPKTLQGSIVVFNGPRSDVARRMVAVLVETPLKKLDADAFLLPKALYEIVAADLELDSLKSGLNEGNSESKWMLLEQNCFGDSEEDGKLIGGDDSMEKSGMSVLESSDLEGSRRRSLQNSLIRSTNGDIRKSVTHQCPIHSTYCCEITNPTTPKTIIAMSRHPIYPSQHIPTTSSFPQPYLSHTHNHTKSTPQIPFISTVREIIYHKNKHQKPTPNFYEMMMTTDCMPTEQKCNSCLRNETGATCESCSEVCSCYCQALCHIVPEEKFVSKEVIVSPPRYKKDPGRLIPRIVHQTWFEPITKEKYPNMSRLIESWKQSGWNYKFYDDDAAREFLATHFPPEVGEAYDAINPGAFKADLFRYCALLIDGGVYADMDVMLESNLDVAIGDDVGFMTPMDTPGIKTGHRMCLWNGLIASAPSHPFLANIIEHVVNNARNRFTSIDIDNLLCPNPELSISRKTDILFTAGPCILGASINQVLGRHPQTPYQAGDLVPSSKKVSIPGRTVILDQNKMDMGAHRFTWLERNLVIAATDLPEYDDRDQLDSDEFDNEHYSSKVHVRKGVYGLENLYVDREIKDEIIKIIIDDLYN